MTRAPFMEQAYKTQGMMELTDLELDLRGNEAACNDDL